MHLSSTCCLPPSVAHEWGSPMWPLSLDSSGTHCADPKLRTDTCCSSQSLGGLWSDYVTTDDIRDTETLQAKVLGKEACQGLLGDSHSSSLRWALP